MLTVNEVKSESGWKTWLAVFLVILVLASASVLGINQYRYGVGDHAITIPFLKSFIKGDLYPNDYLLEQRPYYYTYFWNTLGLLIKHLHVDIPTVFFFSYFISVYMTFLGLYLVAMTLFRKKEVAFLSLFLLLFAKETLAGAYTIEGLIITRVAVLPILLFSIYFFLKERYLLSFLMLGIGFLIHPMTTMYVTAIIFASSLVTFRRIGIRRFLSCIGVFLVSSTPILIWKIVHSPESLRLVYADPQWIELLRLRSSHHIFPLSWSKNILFQAGMLLFVFFISWKHKPKASHHRILVAFMLTILLMCMIGTVFSEIVPVSLILNFQLLRSFQFIAYFAAIYFANYFFLEMLRLKKNIFDRLAVTFVSIGLFYGTAIGQYAFVVFLVLTTFLILYHFVCRREFLLSKYFISILIVLVLGSGVYLRSGDFSIDNAQEERWVDVQRWAKLNTDPEDVFIVPPSITIYGFRVESERTIYGDWKDGTLMNFNPIFGYEWFRRMEKLGYEEGRPLEDGFKDLTEIDFVAIADEVRRNDCRVFMTMFEERERLFFPVVYGNEKFIVYEIKTVVDSLWLEGNQ